MSTHPYGAERMSFPVRARASVFTMIALVVAAVGTAMLLLSSGATPTPAGSDPVAPAATEAAPPSTPPSTAAATEDSRADGVAVDVGPTSSISVQVANSTAVPGAAAALTDTLKALGYVTFSPTNDRSGAVAHTKIHHVDGHLLAAHELARALDLDPAESVFPMPADPSATVDGYEEPQVLVVLGTDLAG